MVLPFANLSGDPAQDYLADALTDELITGVTRVKDSFVIARNTAFTYKGKPVDAKAIGKDLGARYVLEGSVQPTGDRMRVNASFIDAESGAHLSGPTNSTPRAPICCRCRMRSSHVWRTRCTSNSPRRRPRVSNGRQRQIPMPRIWRSNGEGILLKGRVCLGKEADVAYHLCEQALAVDPNNDRAMSFFVHQILVTGWNGRQCRPEGGP